jgi:hypothetical protein
MSIYKVNTMGTFQVDHIFIPYFHTFLIPYMAYFLHESLPR